MNTIQVSSTYTAATSDTKGGCIDAVRYSTVVLYYFTCMPARMTWDRPGDMQHDVGVPEHDSTLERLNNNDMKDC